MLLSYFTPLCGSFCSLDCFYFCLVICPHFFTFTKLFITFCVQKMFGKYFYKKAALFFENGEKFLCLCGKIRRTSIFILFTAHIVHCGRENGQIKELVAHFGRKLFAGRDFAESVCGNKQLNIGNHFQYYRYAGGKRESVFP